MRKRVRAECQRTARITTMTVSDNDSGSSSEMVLTTVAVAVCSLTAFRAGSWRSSFVSNLQFFSDCNVAAFAATAQMVCFLGEERGREREREEERREKERR